MAKLNIKENNINLAVTEAYNKASNSTLDRVANEARRLAPVDTGRLRNSIRVEGNKLIADVPYAEDVNKETGFFTRAINNIL